MHTDKPFSSTNGLAATQAENVDLKEDLARLRKDFALLKDDLLKLGSQRAADASDSIEKNIDKAKTKTSQFMEAADAETRAAATAVQETVRDNPVAALGAAVAFGFVLGRSLLRR